jgi:hypothetical protein
MLYSNVVFLIFSAWLGVAATIHANVLAVPFWTPVISYSRFLLKLSSRISLSRACADRSWRISPSNLTKSRLFLATASYPLATSPRYRLLLSSYSIKGLVPFNMPMAWISSFRRCALIIPAQIRGSSFCLECLQRTVIGCNMLVPRRMAICSNLSIALVRISSCSKGVLGCSK